MDWFIYLLRKDIKIELLIIFTIMKLADMHSNLRNDQNHRHQTSQDSIFFFFFLVRVTKTVVGELFPHCSLHSGVVNKDLTRTDLKLSKKVLDTWTIAFKQHQQGNQPIPGIIKDASLVYTALSRLLVLAQHLRTLQIMTTLSNDLLPVSWSNTQFLNQSARKKVYSLSAIPAHGK